MMRRLIPFALAGLMLAVSQQLFAKYVMWFGFRDHYSSELDTADHILAIYFIWFSLALAVWFLGLGVWSFRADIKKALLYTCLLFLAAAMSSIALDLYFRSYMMDAAGG